MRQIADRARVYLWPNRRKLELVVVLGSVFLFVIYQFVDRASYINFTIEQNILLICIFILLFLEGMATELTRATDQIRNDVSIIPGQGQGSKSNLKRTLSDYIASYRPNEVKMIEYSSSTVDSIIEDAVREGAEIKLLLKHPDSTIPKNQPDKILNQVKSLHSDLNGYQNMEIRFYRQPAGLRARKFDNDLINCGWYTYQYDEIRGTHLKGHTNPTVLLSAEETEEYRYMEDLFDRIFINLWENATTLEEIYENDEEYTGEAVLAFRRWVDQKGCENWVKSLSGNRINTAELHA
ncbi:hypothetical protein [Natronosalvus halobius]|uniref:hypothetical protein n=1 Tax=Natronosalvus halobius TaxID=2953746 RepID=UPI0020A15684|nr:hypothetical protein [Natronosalvus halobius]USZ71492.1 hypothetical protein NGM15_15710 [Natronosalvus halobius]